MRNGSVRHQSGQGDTVSVAAGNYHESVQTVLSITIKGAGAGTTSISGGGAGPSLFVDGLDAATTPTVVISGVSLSENTDSDGLVVEAANATLSDSQVTGNHSDGVLVEGSGHVALTGVNISRNAGDGVDVSDPGLPVVTITHAVIDNNEFEGIDSEAGTSTISKSVIDGNLDGGFVVDGSGSIDHSTVGSNVGAGIVAVGGTVAVSRTTILRTKPFPPDADVPDPFGGGLYVSSASSLTVNESTVFGNTNFGIAVDDRDGSSSAQVRNTTITKTVQGATHSMFVGGLVTTGASTLLLSGTLDVANTTPDCAAGLTDAGYNLGSDGSCPFTAATSHAQSAAVMFGLASNGGSTQTVLPGFHSTARNAIPLGKAGCVAGSKDQRDLPRPDAVTKKCDVGSVEARVLNPKLHAKVHSTKGKSHGKYRGRVTVRFTCKPGTSPLARHCPKAVHARKPGRHHIKRTIHALDGGKATVSVRFRIAKPRRH